MINECVQGGIADTLTPFPTFFLRLPVASVVSFQVPFKGGEAGNTRFLGKILLKYAE